METKTIKIDAYVGSYSFMVEKEREKFFAEHQIPVNFTGILNVEGRYDSSEVTTIEVYFSDGIIGNNSGPALKWKNPYGEDSKYFIFGKPCTKKAWLARKKLGSTIVDEKKIDSIELNCAVTSQQTQRSSSETRVGNVLFKTSSKKLYWVYNISTNQYWGLCSADLISSAETTIYNSGPSIKAASIDFNSRVSENELKRILLEQLQESIKEFLKE